MQGPATDLHSGGFGGEVDNPFNVLVRLLAQLQDGVSRRVLIPGFYDKVAPIDDEERRLLAELPVTHELDARELMGVPAVAGEAGYSAAERLSVRPTLDIHGMPGGFTGEGKDGDPGACAVRQSEYAPGTQPGTARYSWRCLSNTSTR